MTEHLGKPVRRKEDPALLSGRGRYADDLPVPVGTLHAHVIRSPHAHADIVRVDAEQALVDATARFQHRFAFVEDRLRERASRCRIELDGNPRAGTA